MVGGVMCDSPDHEPDELEEVEDVEDLERWLEEGS